MSTNPNWEIKAFNSSYLARMFKMLVTFSHYVIIYQKRLGL